MLCTVKTSHCVHDGLVHSHLCPHFLRVFLPENSEMYNDQSYFASSKCYQSTREVNSKKPLCSVHTGHGKQEKSWNLK